MEIQQLNPENNNQQIPANIQKIAYRANILFFNEDPYFKETQEDALTFYKDGLLVLDLEKGTVIEAGNYQEMRTKYASVQISEEYQDKLIMPGFIDCHTHYPQTEMICSFASSLVNWLNTYTFPTEEQFKDINYAKKISQFYLNELLKNGTTTALVFATIHPESVAALFDEAIRLNMRIITGKTMMNRNAPEFLQDTVEDSYRDSLDLIQNYHNVGRCLYSITPRFAPTSTQEQLNVAGQLKHNYPDTYIHTHLNENLQEVDWVKSLFPESENYLDVYDQSNLVHKQSVFAHCVHCTQPELDKMKQVQCGVAYCPTSNGFLGAGMFPYHQAVQNGINFGMGTDVGGGTDFGMLRTLQDAYKFIMVSQQHVENRRPMTSFEGFYRATLGGCKALSLEHKIGKFLPGYEADFVVLDWCVNDIQRLRFENIEKRASSTQQSTVTSESLKLSTIQPGDDKYLLQDKLFGLMMMGDSNNVYSTHLAGIRRYQRQNKI
ncbi:hypothetical protein ABPG74_018200 [Tetrahymena malaccensis]